MIKKLTEESCELPKFEEKPEPKPKKREEGFEWTLPDSVDGFARGTMPTIRSRPDNIITRNARRRAGQRVRNIQDFWTTTHTG